MLPYFLQKMERLFQVCRVLYDKKLCDVLNELDRLRSAQPRADVDVDVAVDETWCNFVLQFEDAESTLGWYGELYVYHPSYDTSDLNGYVNGCAFCMYNELVCDFLDYIEGSFRERARRVFQRQRDIYL